MSRWGNNAFWAEVTGRLDAQAGTDHSRMSYRNGAWQQECVDQVSAPVLLQGRLLVVDVSDSELRLLPLGTRSRFALDVGFGPQDSAVRSLSCRPGAAVRHGDGGEVTVRVSTTLPVVELELRGTAAPESAERAWVRWPGEERRDLAGQEFRMPPSFHQDPLTERNNSVAPDPLPLTDGPDAGVGIRVLAGRIVLATAPSAGEAVTALDDWETERGEQVGYWDAVAARLSFDVPDGAVGRQLPYSVHNSLFSRSIDATGRDIFLHGRRDRGYADASHLHQSYQMYLPALAAGEQRSVRDELVAFCALQDRDGWIELAPRPLRGASRYVGRYTSAHLLLAVHRYLSWTGDSTLLDEVVVSSEDPVARSVRDRVDRAANDLVGHRYRGVLQPCGWADAWNPDVRAQGQISAAAVLGLRAWAEVTEHDGRPDRAAGLRETAEGIVHSVCRELYDPDTGLVAEHLFDSGPQGGSSTDFWAHTQIWSFLAGIAPDGRGLDAVVAQCLDHGVSIAPESAFDSAYVAASTDSVSSLPVESTATWLLARWPEVTHLYALAELARGRPDAALAAVHAQLPETLHALDGRCPPFYYAEKYLYPGTRPWLCTWAGDPSLIEVVLSGFLGVHATLDGLHIRPLLPSSWSRPVVADFVWRGRPHRLTVSPDVPVGEVTVDGIPDVSRRFVLRDDGAARDRRIDITVGTALNRLHSFGHNA